MNRLRMPLLALVAGLAFSCQDDLNTVPAPTTGVLLNATFAEGKNGWEGDYTDYGTAQAELIAFKFEHTGLPAPLDPAQKALRVFGRNRSDDLFMFIRKQITGLVPNRAYKLVFNIELASLYPANSIGIGGSPGSSVFLKAGATATKPEKVKAGDYYTFSVDKGAQSDVGKDAVALGNVANGKDVAEYTLIRRANAEAPFTARTNDKGELWIYVGTDSGFEGDQSLYYHKVTVTAL